MKCHLLQIHAEVVARVVDRQVLRLRHRGGKSAGPGHRPGPEPKDQPVKGSKGRSRAAAHPPNGAESAREVHVHVASGGAHEPRERRVAGVGGRRPVAARGGAATGQHRAARRAARIESGRHGRIEVLVVGDALELPHVGHPPVRVPGEAHRVECRGVPGERLVPRVGVAHVVGGAVAALFLPHKAGVVIGDRSVPVVRVRERRAGLDIAIVTRARTRDHGPAAVPAGRLAGRRLRTCRARGRGGGRGRRAGRRGRGGRGGRRGGGCARGGAAGHRRGRRRGAGGRLCRRGGRGGRRGGGGRCRSGRGGGGGRAC